MTEHFSVGDALGIIDFKIHQIDSYVRIIMSDKEVKKSVKLIKIYNNFIVPEEIIYALYLAGTLTASRENMERVPYC